MREIKEYMSYDKLLHAELTDYLTSFPWHLKADLCFKNYNYQEPLKLFIRKMGKEESLQVCAMGLWVDSYTRGIHSHCFFYGRSGKTGKTLLDVNPEYWSLQWAEFAHRSGEFKPLHSQYDINGTVGYALDSRNRSQEIVIVNGKRCIRSLPSSLIYHNQGLINTLHKYKENP